MRHPARAATVALAMVLFGASALANERVIIGSKAFPESWILGEAAASLARSAGANPRHAQNLGATEITYAALATGSIDLYPEYTGTVCEVILGGRFDSIEAAKGELARRGIAVTDALGFQDRYALATTARHALRAISDLGRAPDLRFGLTHEFLGRADGWAGLVARYALAPRDVRGLQHELAIEALARGDLDVVDVYTTDPQIARLALRVLDDDRGFFPRYDAVFLYRADLPSRAPRAFAAITRLVGRVDETTMQRANARVALEGVRTEDAARSLVREALGADIALAGHASLAGEVARNTLRHLLLVFVSLVASIVLGVPLGVAATRSRLVATATLSLAGILQTVPSLALLALLVPILGIGATPALVALFLYGLLPIVRGTHAGIITIAPAITESAEALGLPWRARLRHVLLPLASPHILAGVRTSAVIGVGTATLAALIGAEGLGGPILQGIALRDTARVLEGAVPAALLALVVDGAFAIVERFVVPHGLRLASARNGLRRDARNPP